MIRRPPRSTLFPYTTSSDRADEQPGGDGCAAGLDGSSEPDAASSGGAPSSEDRKSTRLNSSHTVSSYAVFCLKKKKSHLRMHASYTTEHDNTSTHWKRR